MCFIFLSMLFCSQLISAQVKKVTINTDGDYEVTVRLGYDRFITIGPNGEITNIEINGSFDYYSDFDGEYQSGKLKRIDGIQFTYYSNFDGDYRMGKIKKIGNMQLDYYSQFDGDYQIGKVKKIDNINFAYYSVFDGDHQVGKIKQIGESTFTYFSKYNSNSLTGKLKSGTTPVRNDGISFYLQY